MHHISFRNTGQGGRAVAAALALALAVAPATGIAADPDVDELRREVKALRAEVDSLRAAMAETASLDRERAAAVTRALKSSGPNATSNSSGDEAPAPAPVAARREEAPARAPVQGKGGAAVAAAAAPRRREPEPAAMGIVRGKIEVPNGEPIAYVYVENVPGALVRDKVKIEQMHKQFVPSWAVVQRGTTVEFPNLDTIYHNVFSLSSGNSFDLGLYNSAGEAKSHTFTEPGAVDVYCNIHPQMAASVLVVPNRYYTKVKKDGSFELTDVPAGRRKVVAWSPGSKLASQWVELKAGGEGTVALKLEARSSTHKNKLGRAYGSYD